MVGLFQSYTVTLDGLYHLVDGSILSYHVVLQFCGHALQSDTLLFSHTLGGHTGHHRYHLGHLVGIYSKLFAALAVSPALVQLLQLLVEHHLTVAIAGSQFVVLVLHRLRLLLLHLFQFLLLLDYLGWHLCIAQMYLRASLVESIDGLVGHESVGNVAVCQFDTSLQSLVGVLHVVMLLVAVLYVVQYLQCLLGSGRLYLYLLESALQSTVLLYALAILIQCGCTYALYGAAGQCWLHYVGSIHTAGGRTRTDDGVYLIDEYDNIWIGLKLLHQCLESLLKLSAILGAGHHARHVERVNTLAKQHRTGVTLLYQLCQSFYYSTLAHTRLTDKYRVVLLAAAQYLDYALNLAHAAHAWVKLTLGSSLCKVGAETVQYGCLRVWFLLCGSGALLIVAGALATSGLLVFLLFLVG